MLPSTQSILTTAALIRSSPIEQALALYVRDSQILHHTRVSKSHQFDQVSIDAKTLFETGWRVHAQSYILVHSHPSGIVEPSLSDLSVTDFLADISAALKLPLADHYIVGLTGHFSFVKAGLLEKSLCEEPQEVLVVSDTAQQ